MNDEVLLELKPKFNRWEILILWLFASYASVFVYITLFAIIALVRRNPNATMSCGGYFITLCTYGSIWVTWKVFVIKRNYKATTYRVYRDRIQFDEGFIDHKNTVIKMSDIKEVQLSQGIFQKKEKIGSISFVTPANNSNHRRERTGIEFKDIENPKIVYEMIGKIYANQNNKFDADSEVLLEIKPKFVPWMQNISGWVGALIFCFTLGIALAVFPSAIVMRVFNIPPSMTYWVYFLVLCLLGKIWVVLRNLVIRKEYEETLYKVYRDRIEVENKFFIPTYYVIKMADIKEINLEQGFLQRKIGFGGISFVTAANSYATATGGYFKDIENSKDVYDTIKKIYDYVNGRI
ncbi:MAG: PH domain-containing protein [Alphaproteobacteria bacterium]|nr:PH domain-containing protein [Alphaproteobacteria bacterium]